VIHTHQIPRDMQQGLLSLPEHMRDGVADYIFFGIEPGGFLYAILSNDLYGACRRADDINAVCIFAYMFFLHNYAPSECFGSEERVQAWTKKRGLVGAEQEKAAR